MSLPGLREDDIQIGFQEGRLTITGERKLEIEENRQRFHLLETQYGAFNRTFNLPDNLNPENIEAQFEEECLKSIWRKMRKKSKSTRSW